MTVKVQIKKHIQSLSKDIGEHNVFHPEALKKAGNYIENKWRSQGYKVKRYSYKANGIKCSNFEVSHTGTEKPDEIILIGAHYDTVEGSPGANDNSSGIATMLAMSRQLSNIGTDRTVRFVAFVNEEFPFCHTAEMGSRVYAKVAAVRHDNIVGVIVLETIGYYSNEPGSQQYPSIEIKSRYPNTGNFIAFVSNMDSQSWLQKVFSEFKNSTDFPSESLAMPAHLAEGVDSSDHSSFWLYGYKALMVTDTAPYRYPF